MAICTHCAAAQIREQNCVTVARELNHISLGRLFLVPRHSIVSMLAQRCAFKHTDFTTTDLHPGNDQRQAAVAALEAATAAAAKHKRENSEPN